MREASETAVCGLSISAQAYADPGALAKVLAPGPVPSPRGIRMNLTGTAGASHQTHLPFTRSL